MINVFNSNYEEIGSLNKNLVLQTLGKVKIRFGKKFVDILDDKGNLNVKIPKVIQEVNSQSEMTKDGLYLYSNNLYAKVGNDSLQVTGIDGEYIKYGENQSLNQEQIDTAQKNLGIKFDSLSNVSISNGIFYVGNDIYYTNDGQIQKLTLNTPLKEINQQDLSIPFENAFLIFKNGQWNYQLFQESSGTNNLNTPLKEINSSSLGNPENKIEETEENEEIKSLFGIIYDSDIQQWRYESVVPYSEYQTLYNDLNTKYTVKWYLTDTTNQVGETIVRKGDCAIPPTSIKIDQDNGYYLIESWDYNNSPITEDTEIYADAYIFIQS